jgi:hypothetical protein
MTNSCKASVLKTVMMGNGVSKKDVKLCDVIKDSVFVFSKYEINLLFSRS